MDKELALLAIVESSIENSAKIGTEILQRAGRSRALPKTYKDSLRKLSLALTCTANHFNDYKEALKEKDLLT